MIQTRLDLSSEKYTVKSNLIISKLILILSTQRPLGFMYLLKMKLILLI